METKRGKIKATGEIVEELTYSLHREHIGEYENGNGNYYKREEWEELPEPVIQVAAFITGWVARDSDGTIKVYRRFPIRKQDHWQGDMLAALPSKSMPAITWESTPRKVSHFIHVVAI